MVTPCKVSVTSPRFVEGGVETVWASTKPVDKTALNRSFRTLRIMFSPGGILPLTAFDVKLGAVAVGARRVLAYLNQTITQRPARPHFALRTINFSFRNLFIGTRNHECRLTLGRFQ